MVPVWKSSTRPIADTIVVSFNAITNWLQVWKHEFGAWGKTILRMVFHINTQTSTNSIAQQERLDTYDSSDVGWV